MSDENPPNSAGRGGRKKAVFDYDKVEALAAKGLTIEEIALTFGYTAVTFYKAKRVNAGIEEAIRRGKAKFKVILTDILIKQAQDGNATAAIWLDKTRCGTREKEDDENLSVTPVKVVIEVKDASGKSRGE